MFQSAYAALILAILLPPLHEAPRQLPQAKSAHEVQDRLSLKISLVEGFQSTTLKDALGYISEAYGLTILVDGEVFKELLNITEPEIQAVKLPPVRNVSLRVIMRFLCEQAQADFVQAGTFLWVVPKQQVLPRVLKQEVDVTFDKRPLNEALKQISDQTGLNIVLDEQRAGDASKTPVTARLRGVGLEAAVRILADMAGLKVFTTDKVLYVTTPENAEELRQEDQRRLKEQEKKQKETGKEEEKQEKGTPKKEVKLNANRRP